MARRPPTDLLLALVYFVVGSIWIASMPELARLDRDEGFNLMKADLVQRGYRLYREIWSDQPPLFTHLLVAWRRVFGESDSAARMLVLTMTSIGLACAGRLATWFAGGRTLAGALTVLLLIGARSYPKLSMAVMIGLPAISTALAAIVLLRWSTTLRWGWVIVPVSGGLFAASMQIKLFTFILAPMLFATYFVSRRRDGQRPAIDLVLLLSAFAVVSYLAGPFREPGWQQQLVRTHVKTGLATDDTQLQALRSVLMRFIEDAPLMLAMAAGLYAAGRATARRCLPALAWIIASVIVLSQANPLWGHHRVMFSIPAAMIAGACLAEVWSRSRAAPRRDMPTGLAFASAGLAFAYGLAQVTGSIIGLGRGDDTNDAEIVDRLRRDRDRIRWVISDDPHIVHAAGLVVPPETAVLSLKRLQRDLTEDRFAQIIDRYQPEVIILARHTYTPEFVQRVTRGYELVISKKKDRVRMFERTLPTTTAPSASPG
jgi:hypothetical protein